MTNNTTRTAQSDDHEGRPSQDEGSAPLSAGLGSVPQSEGVSIESPPPAPIPPLLLLPPELLSLILSHVPAQQYQRTALALHKVLPDHGLAEEHLWRHVIVKRAEQLMPLWKAARIRRDRFKGMLAEQRMDDVVRRAQMREGSDDGSEAEDEVDEEEKEDEERVALGKKMGLGSFAMESWRGDADVLNK